MDKRCKQSVNAVDAMRVPVRGCHQAQIRPLLELLHDQAGGDVFLSKVRPGNHHGQLSLTLHMQPWCTQRLIGALMQHLQQAEISRVEHMLAA